MNNPDVLTEYVKELGRTLTPLDHIARLSTSQKIGCCGGAVARLLSENSSDSTVLLRDSTGTCLCTIHGEITARYPFAVSTSAVLVLTDVTVIVLSSNVPPLLVACLSNLSGLLLPEEEASTTSQPPPTTKTTTTHFMDQQIPPSAYAPPLSIPNPTVNTPMGVESDEDCLEMVDGL